MTGQYIFLDDIRTPLGTTHVKIPNYPYTIVRNYNEFVKSVQEYYDLVGDSPVFVTFDHDLSDTQYVLNPDYSDPNEKTGFHCASWLIYFCRDNNLDFPEYMVHSMNPKGKENIIGWIESHRKLINFKDERLEKSVVS